MSDANPLKFFDAVGSSVDDLRAFPKKVRRTVGVALLEAQRGGRDRLNTKVLTGFGGAGVVEVLEDDDGKTYRAVYTVRFAGVVYLLHAFEKKSKKGSETPPREVNKVRARLKDAEVMYAEWYATQDAEKKAPK